MKKLLPALLLVSFAALGLYAQNETHWLPDQPGKWSYHHKLVGEIEYYKLSPTEIDSYKQKIETIIETFHQNPVLKNPVGFEPSVNVRMLDENSLFKGTPTATSLVGARIAIQFCPYFQDESGNVKKFCTEVTSCDILYNCPKLTHEKYLNYKGDGYHNELSVAAEKLNRIFIKPLVAKELTEGVTAYSSGIIIVAGTTRPYWIPVSVGELFELQLNYYELDYKLNKKEDIPYVIDVIKQEKAACSPEELKLPAYFDNSFISSVTKEVNESPYVRFNPDYIDRSLPRTAVQILAVHTQTEAYYDHCRYEYLEYLRHCEFVKQIDGNALKALLDVK